MTVEEQVIRDFRAMDDETRLEAAAMFRNLARDFPRGPRLRIAGLIGVDTIALHPLEDTSKPGPVSLRKRPIIG